MSQESAHGARLQTIGDLQQRRNQLLDEIKRSETDPQTPNADVLFQKERYNTLVDDLIRMETGPFIDPLESLPLELWINIISSLNDGASDGSNPINQLLTLTCVSKTWSDALLSIPSFWTTVILNGHEEDCFAKAITSIELSGTLELDMTIVLSSESWNEIAPMVVPYRRRVHTLRITTQSPSHILSIPRAFGHLPGLRNLILPELNLFKSPEILDTSTLKLMPSIQTIKSLPLSHDVVASLRHSGIQSIEIVEFDKRMVETLVGLPNLRHLKLDLSSHSPLTAQLPSSNLRLPISTMYVSRVLSYPLDSILGCLGLGLQRITVIRLEVARFFNTISSLQQFEYLIHVSLYISQDHAPSGEPPDSSTSYNLPSVKSLELSFGSLVFGLDIFAFSQTELSIPWIDAIGRSLVTAFPSVESLVCKGRVPSGNLLPYIMQLTKLRSLFLECYSATAANPPSSLVGEHLEELGWTGSPPTDFFDQLSCPALRTLHLVAISRNLENALRSPEASGPQVVYFPTQIPPSAASSVTKLSLTMYSTFLWDLSSFSALKKIKIGESLWASDVFEQLLLRPNDCPNLEHITVEGTYYEWDILLLMLERRAFATLPWVTSIKSITFSRALSSPLLRVISELLRGKFPIGTQASEFSLEAIGDRMFDPSRPGCTRCCQESRNCDSSSGPRLTVDPFRSSRLAQEYYLPCELLSADPPMNLWVWNWITRKRERRVNYASSCINAKFQRIPDCAREISSPSTVVTAYSVDFD